MCAAHSRRLDCGSRKPQVALEVRAVLVVLEQQCDAAPGCLCVVDTPINQSPPGGCALKRFADQRHVAGVGLHARAQQPVPDHEVVDAGREVIGSEVGRSRVGSDESIR
jgi:hypothetical protein